MNYELAKKLKDAGYPITKCIDNGCDVVELHHPSLSELIEACIGNGRIQLNIAEDGCGVWWGTKHAKSVFEEGKTPEEAVSNLWLELNKKNV